ncbi:hypothetical protein [Kribbella sp. NPDC051770]|uniref:hypothetical protein n=1 Tax=Kribbella sp. NPDC051770 TaxID=3155413 RepID=UPI00342B3F6F
MLLGEAWPRLAGQVRDALTRDGEHELAAQIDGLPVVQRCECGDDFCQSFHTAPPPDGGYPLERHRNWYAEDSPGWDGELVLDVVDGLVVYVEVLDREPLD